MVTRRSLIPAAGVVAAATCLVPLPAGASQLIDRNAHAVRLAVSSDGETALLSYRKADAFRRVVAWGATNARHPTITRPQVRFSLDYSGGRSLTARSRLRSFRDACLPYDGPRLHWLVTACRAPDGSYWAVQEWQRLLPIRGSGSDDVPRELRLSHWRGATAHLMVKLDWAYGGRWDNLYGQPTYRGVPVHGFSSTHKGAPLDTYGRNIYLDTLDSAYGRGWRRENGFLAQGPGGVFCYTFLSSRGLSGMGSAYRATVVGPGVTPDVFWSSPAPGSFDAELDQAANAEERELFAQSCFCRVN